MPYKNPPPCSMDGCNKKVNARGLCSKHYYRLRVHGDPNKVIVRERARCSVDGCGKDAWAQKLCEMHLWRVKRNGSTDDPRQTEAQRFWSKVRKTDTPPEFRPDLDGCWLWEGAHSELGHGLFFPSRRSPIGAHRYAFIEAGGAIPDGFHIDHLCRVPACVNPAHLEPVTPKENQRRGLQGVLRKEATNRV